MTSDLDQARYIAFVSYKRDGTAKSTPTWVTPYGDGYAFTTEATSFKVRRVKNNSKVTIAPSNIRGIVAKNATVREGVAEIIDDHRANDVDNLIKHKYRFSRLVLVVPVDFVKRLRGRTLPATVAVAIRLTS